MSNILDEISCPADLRKLSKPELVQLAGELRKEIIDTVGETGGHLASNLGAVELTIALHAAMNCPVDKLIFDVGHQCYAHKLLTGRRASFALLRCDGGASGFPKRSESEYDCFGTGHASTSISAALGFARARDLLVERYKVAALIGDGAMTGGLAYEALNDAGARKSQFLVVLNDNEMSIARNVGGLDKHLTRLRVSRKWRGAKRLVKGGLDAVPVIGPPVSRALEWAKSKVRALIVPGSFFESLGFRYLGPIDGHDLDILIPTIRNALAWEYPTLLHVVTLKGRGSPEAEGFPEKYHGVSANGHSHKESYADLDLKQCAPVVGSALAELARSDRSVVAITAAMPSGTGLDIFREEHPERFFDVGIAEEHAVTLAAGMTAGGVKPYVAIYSTFLQRAVDQVIHDVCLQNLPVTLLVDHAGFVECDGATHQGLFDVSLLRTIPNMTIWTPSDLAELRGMIMRSAVFNAPLVIRYPKSLPDTMGAASDNPAEWIVAREVSDKVGAALFASGSALPVAMDCASILSERGIVTAVIRASSAKPLCARSITRFADLGVLIVTIEEGQRAGGFGSAIAEFCAEYRYLPPLLIGAGDSFVNALALDALRSDGGLTALAIADAVTGRLQAQFSDNA